MMKKIGLIFFFFISIHLSHGQQYPCQDIYFPTLNSSLYQGVYYSDLKWNNGSTLTVSFLNGDPYLQSKVKTYASVWSNFANIQFKFVDDKESNIRISFYQGKGSWSLIGKQSDVFSADIYTGRSINGKNGPSMNFGWFTHNTPEAEFQRTILHEFGHALGLLHEHLNALSNIKWNVPKVYAYYMQTQNWSKDEVDKNVFDKYSVTQSNSSYDPNSIMHYPISKDLTLDGYEVGWNMNLSNGDKTIISKMYPLNMPVTDGLNYRISNLCFGDGIWSLTMSKQNTNYGQAYRTSPFFPEKEIEKLWDQGYSITNLSYGNGMWALVMSQNAYSYQQWVTDKNFPQHMIQKFYKKGYEITELSYGNNVWSLVMSKGSTYIAQQWRTSVFFPKEEIESLGNAGYAITNLSYGNGMWALVMSKGAGYTVQEWRTRDYYPKDEIQTLWDKGYHITHLTYGNGVWAVVMSRGTNYTAQSWRTRTYFLKDEIEELWKK